MRFSGREKNNNSEHVETGSTVRIRVQQMRVPENWVHKSKLWPHIDFEIYCTHLSELLFVPKMTISTKAKMNNSHSHAASAAGFRAGKESPQKLFTALIPVLAAAVATMGICS